MHTPWHTPVTITRIHDEWDNAWGPAASGVLNSVLCPEGGWWSFTFTAYVFGGVGLAPFDVIVGFLVNGVQTKALAEESAVAPGEAHTFALTWQGQLEVGDLVEVVWVDVLVVPTGTGFNRMLGGIRLADR